MAGGIDYPRLIFFGMLFETQKRFVLHWSWMMIILQIYNNDWLEIVVYTERTGTIEIEFVAKNWIIFSNFFFFILFFIFRVLGFFRI